MKKIITVCVICILIMSGFALADEYDLENMTSSELRSLKNIVDKYIEKDHEPTSSERSRIESLVKKEVEKDYGSNNVSWAWFDYSYAKEWDFFTMQTHADVQKSNENARCDIHAEVVRAHDFYMIVYLQVGDSILIDERDEEIKDDRVRKMLGLSTNMQVTDSEVREKNTEAIDTNTETQEEPNCDTPSKASEEVENEQKVAIIAKRGDKNDTVREIQNMLIRLGYLNGKADGDFGGMTETAVKSFQSSNSLEQTGIVTEEVFKAIENAASEIPEPIVYPRYTAKEVYSEYDSNEIAGDSKFKGKIIEVTGKICEISTVWGTPYVDLKADSYGFERLVFSFSKKSVDQLATIKENQTITIRGKCTGLSLLSVYFDDAEIVG